MCKFIKILPKIISILGYKLVTWGIMLPHCNFICVLYHFGLPIILTKKELVHVAKAYRQTR